MSLKTPESKANVPSIEQPAPAFGPPPGPPKRHRRVWLLVICLIIALGAGLLLHHRTAVPNSRAKSGSVPPPVQVGTVVVRKGDIGIYVNALGAVTPLNTVMVKSRVDGQLMTVNYLEGQMVQAGDSLVQIDPRPYQAQLTQAEGQLARDKALLENARIDLDRYQTAFSKNAIPKQQLDTQVATVHQYEGTVEFDQGQVDNAQLQITYSHIAAPISGRVGLRWSTGATLSTRPIPIPSPSSLSFSRSPSSLVWRKITCLKSSCS